MEPEEARRSALGIARKLGMQEADQDDAAQRAAIKAWQWGARQCVPGTGLQNAIAKSTVKDVRTENNRFYFEGRQFPDGEDERHMALADPKADVIQAVHTLMLCDSLMELIDELPRRDARIIREAMANGRVDLSRRVQLCNARKRLWDLAKERGIL